MINFHLQSKTIYNLLLACTKNMISKKNGWLIWTPCSKGNLCVCVKSMYQQVLLLRLHHNVFNVLMFYLFSTSNSYTAHGQLKRQKDLFVKLKNMEIMRITKPDWRLVTMQAMLKQIGLKITNWYVHQWNVK